MKTYHLQEKLSSKDIGVVKTALKNGKMVIGYLIPNSKNSDSRMGKQKFQFLKLTDTEADIIWLPPSHREPYPASEWRKIPKDKKAKLTVGGVFDSIKDPELVERVGFSDFEIVDPLNGDYVETGLMSRRVQKRHKRDLEETDQLNELLTMVNPEEWVDLQLRDQRGSTKNWTRERFIKVTNNFEMRKHISSFGFKATRELADEVMSIRDKKLKESVEEDIGLVALNNIKSRLEEKRNLVMLQRQKTVSKNHTKRVSKSVLECRAMRISKRTIIKEMLGEKDYQDLNAIQRKRVMERLKEKQYGVIQLAKSILPKLISSNQN